MIADRTVYVSGCLGIDKDTGKLVPGGVIPETRKALENLDAILKAAGSSYEKVVKTTIFVQNLEEFASINDEYKKGKHTNLNTNVWLIVKCTILLKSSKQQCMSWTEFLILDYLDNIKLLIDEIP